MGCQPCSTRHRTCEVVARTGIGVDAVDLAEATRRGVAVTNTPDGPDGFDRGTHRLP